MFGGPLKYRWFCSDGFVLNFDVTLSELALVHNND